MGYTDYNEIVNKKELTALFLNNLTDFSSWGTGSYKSLEHLLSEINLQECYLAKSSGGLTRVVEVAAVDVYFSKGDFMNYN